MTSILKVDTIQDADGNNIINESGNTITIGASGDTTNIVGTLQNNGAAVGGTNTPAFMAKPSGNISISNDTVTKLLFATEDFDTDSDYASSRFTPTTAGKYQVSGAVQWNTDTNYDGLYQGRLLLYKNGSQIFRNDIDPRVSTGDVPISDFNYINVAVDMNGSSDYLELYGYVNVDTGNGALSNFWQTNSYFTAFRIIT
jgi:hypothetical protein